VVKLLTHESFAISESLVAELAGQGIQLEILSTGDAGSMTAGAVLAAGSPTADLIFGVDNTLIARAVGEGVFEPYTSPELQYVLPEFQNLTLDGLVTPIDFGDVCINVDNTWFADNGQPIPQTLEELPAAAAELVVQDPGTSSPGLAFLLATVARFGDTWPQYWQQLRDGGVKVAGSWTDAYYTDFTLNGGQRPLVVSYATSPAAEVIYAEDASITQPSTTSMNDSCYRQVEFAGVLAGAANPDGAQKVIDWMLSPAVQEDIPPNMFVYPVRSGVVLPTEFSDFTPVVETSAQLDPAVVSDQLETILQTWGEVMGR
jgi:thiamine transport system substrate-binding protein